MQDPACLNLFETVHLVIFSFRPPPHSLCFHEMYVFSQSLPMIILKFTISQNKKKSCILSWDFIHLVFLSLKKIDLNELKNIIFFLKRSVFAKKKKKPVIFLGLHWANRSFCYFTRLINIDKIFHILWTTSNTNNPRPRRSPEFVII